MKESRRFLFSSPLSFGCEGEGEGVRRRNHEKLGRCNETVVDSDCGNK